MAVPGRMLEGAVPLNYHVISDIPTLIVYKTDEWVSSNQDSLQLGTG